MSDDMPGREMTNQGRFPGANIRAGATIGAYAIVPSALGGYAYDANAYRDERNGDLIVRLGCHHRTIREWDEDFDNNPKEFPRDSPGWKQRKLVYDFLRAWLVNEYPEVEKWI